jgi:YD repeat-containing protein
MKGGSVSYEYFNDDLLKKASYANGAVSNYTYTPRNQVESIKHSINSALVSELSYTYDSNDNRKTETKNNGTGEVVTRYDFDNNDRIERIDYPAQYNELAKTVAYQFDAANNRELETITQAGSSSTKTYTYNNLDQLTNISSTDAENTQVKYDYDANGNLEQKRSSKTINNITQTETNDYTFDIRGQLKSVTMGGSSIGQFLYDDGGQRLRTQYNTLENGQATTQTDAQHSLYQGLKLISQYDVSESNSLSLNANFQFAGGMNIGRRAYGESDSANNTQTYYHTDALGSVLATSKANKSIAARYDYDAWGKELNNTDTSDNPIGYTGHQMDRESENKTG